MDVEVVAIGNEIFSGFTVNSNAAFISRSLLKEGLETAYQTILPDEEEAIFLGLKRAMERSSLVIATGGLGPTGDDVTRSAVARLFDSPLDYNHKIAGHLKERYGEDLSTLKDQATLPQKAEVFPNYLGTASGLHLVQGGSHLYLLPGVPQEMHALLLEQVVPQIKAEFSPQKARERRWLYFFSMVEAELDPLLRQIRKEYPGFSYGLYPALGLLSLEISTESGKTKDLDIAEYAIKKNFGTHCFQAESGMIEEAVHTLFIERGLTLSLAESCTGGAIASRLTKLPGASGYFWGGLVAYSNRMKRDLLSVSEESLEKEGAVSRAVVEQMVKGVLEMSGSDWGIAVSGIAGPGGGSPDKPVGTVYAAIAHRGEEPHIWQIHGRGSREMVIGFSVNTILGHLHRLAFLRPLK